MEFTYLCLFVDLITAIEILLTCKGSERGKLGTGICLFLYKKMELDFLGLVSSLGIGIFYYCSAGNRFPPPFRTLLVHIKLYLV